MLGGPSFDLLRRKLQLKEVLQNICCQIVDDLPAVRQICAARGVAGTGGLSGAAVLQPRLRAVSAVYCAATLLIQDIVLAKMSAASTFCVLHSGSLLFDMGVIILLTQEIITLIM